MSSVTVAAEHIERLEASRSKLYRAIGAPSDLTFFLTDGNVGDLLIQAGTRQLLSGVPCGEYREVPVGLAGECRGHTALISGGGGWCGPFHGLPSCLADIEARFERVVVLPSSFDTSVDEVRRALEGSSAVFFAREDVSFGKIRSLCRAEIADDCALFFDYRPYQREGQDVLTAFRTDEESAFRRVPPENLDVSVVCNDLEEWLSVIAGHDLVRTDRAHVTIAGALLGKRVEYLASSYHKVPAIIDYSLRRFPVRRLPDDWMDAYELGGSELTDAERLRMLKRHIDTFVPEGTSFLLIDDDRLHAFSTEGRRRLPFVERGGSYWGAPADDEEAIGELERMRADGAAFAVFAWPSFWWLDHYVGLRRHLSSAYTCRLRDEVAVLFDLRPGRGVHATPST